MIKSFAHKGLEDFFHKGTTKGIQAKHSARLRFILDLLDFAGAVEDMNFSGSGLHPLKGELKGHWSVRVSGNWRLTFRFEDGNAYVVDYQDYH
jgi:proteic killer suppression protein